MEAVFLKGAREVFNLALNYVLMSETRKLPLPGPLITVFIVLHFKGCFGMETLSSDNRPLSAIYNLRVGGHLI